MVELCPIVVYVFSFPGSKVNFQIIIGIYSFAFRGKLVNRENMYNTVHVLLYHDMIKGMT